MLQPFVHAALDWAAARTPLAAAGWFLLLNVVLFFASLLGGHLLIRGFAGRRVTPSPGPVQREEIVLAALSVIANALISLLGWYLWRSGVLIVPRDTVWWRVLLDAFVLLMAMDISMYGLHRLAHLPAFYPWLHRPHHRYDCPRPLNLYVLSPLEAFAFGALWLLVLCLYRPTFLGIGLYVALNLAWGTMGHLGVEPLPASWRRHPVLCHL